MDDAGVRRDHLEVLETRPGPSAGTRSAPGCARTRARRCARTRCREPNTSTCTEWSMTSSAGTSGLILFGSPPISRIASRIAARSTTAGTPVKSCMTTRAGVNAISLLGSSLAFQVASASMSCARIDSPSSLRSRFSSRIFSENGSRAMSNRRTAARRGGRSRTCARPRSAWPWRRSCSVSISGLLVSEVPLTLGPSRHRAVPSPDAAGRLAQHPVAFATRLSYARLSDVFDPASRRRRCSLAASNPSASRRPTMSVLNRAIAGLATLAVGAALAAAAYTEAHRAPDQP